MSVTILLNDAGEKINLDARPEDVSVESGVLIVRRGKTVIARIRRHVGWWHEADTTTD